MGDNVVERLFADVNLGHLWTNVKDQLDTPGIAWIDVLSPGEQQRLQFCRLFWHFEWHQQCHHGKSFFAILDESTGSMDTDSEATVHRACLERGFGYLSVAHRPTVIQFHTDV